jgi:hypothetical protein
MFVVAELLESRIDAVATNRVCWGSHSALVAIVSHLPELDVDLDVLGSRRVAGLTDDEVDALWSRVHVASDSLPSLVPSSVAHNPPDSVGE